MLHTIAFISKILGIVLLALLALLLLLAYAVLFVPVICEIRAEAKKEVHVSLAGRWLFRVLTVHYTLDGPGEWKQELKVRILGFLVQRPAKKRKRPRQQKKKEEHKERRTMERAGREAGPPQGAGPRQEDARAEEPEMEPRLKRERPSPWECVKAALFRLADAARRILDTLRRIKEAFQELPGRICAIFDRRDALLEFWGLPEHQRARRALFIEARYLLKKLRPKRTEGYVQFGFDDPSVTGKMMGVLAAASPWLPPKLQLFPVFDRRVLEGELLIKGKLRLYVLARILRRIYFNRDVRHMYESWKEL